MLDTELGEPLFDKLKVLKHAPPRSQIKVAPPAQPVHRWAPTKPKIAALLLEALKLGVNGELLPGGQPIMIAVQATDGGSKPLNHYSQVLGRV